MANPTTYKNNAAIEIGKILSQLGRNVAIRAAAKNVAIVPNMHIS